MGQLKNLAKKKLKRGDEICLVGEDIDKADVRD